MGRQRQMAGDITIEMHNGEGELVTHNFNLSGLVTGCACCRKVKPVVMILASLDAGKIFMFCRDCRRNLYKASIELCATEAAEYRAELARLN